MSFSNWFHIGIYNLRNDHRSYQLTVTQIVYEGDVISCKFHSYQRLLHFACIEIFLPFYFYAGFCCAFFYFLHIFFYPPWIVCNIYDYTLYQFAFTVNKKKSSFGFYFIFLRLITDTFCTLYRLSIVKRIQIMIAHNIWINRIFTNLINLRNSINIIFFFCAIFVVLRHCFQWRLIKMLSYYNSSSLIVAC